HCTGTPNPAETEPWPTKTIFHLMAEFLKRPGLPSRPALFIFSAKHSASNPSRRTAFQVIEKDKPDRG
ncbi:MAG: hypothetical protein PVH87_23370, partial [Desulfobacteraceae bacterium]